MRYPQAYRACFVTTSIITSNPKSSFIFRRQLVCDTPATVRPRRPRPRKQLVILVLPQATRSWKAAGMKLGVRSFAIPVALVGPLTMCVIMSLFLLAIFRVFHKEPSIANVYSSSSKGRPPPHVGLLEIWRLSKETEGIEQNKLAVLSTIERKYGQLFTTGFGPFKLLIASGNEIIRYILRLRERTLAFEATYKMADKVNFAQKRDRALGPQNYEKRQTLLKNIGFDFGKTSKILTGCQQSFESEARKQLQAWAEESSQGKPVNLHRAMSKAVILTTLRTLLGPTFARTHGDEVWRAFTKWETLAYRPPWILFPEVSRRINPRLGHAFWTFTNVFSDWVRDLYSHPDLIPSGTYIETVLKRTEPDLRSAVAGHITGMLVGVHINTAASGAWVVAQALRHQELLSKARSESETYEFKDWKDPEAMPTMTMLFHEVLRFYFTGISMREVREDLHFHDIVVPGDGRSLLVSFYSSHRDPTFYDNPNEFIADRFQDLEFLASAVQSKQLLLWGDGPHLCPGRFFATAMLRTLWSELLRSYDVSFFDENKPLPAQGAKSLGVALPTEPIYVRVTKRH